MWKLSDNDFNDIKSTIENLDISEYTLRFEGFKDKETRDTKISKLGLMGYTIIALHSSIIVVNDFDITVYCEPSTYINDDNTNIELDKNSKFKDMKMFKIDLSNIGFKYVDTYTELFSNCDKLIELGKNNLDKRDKEVIDMDRMFNGCKRIRRVDIDIVGVGSADRLFSGCLELGSIGIKGDSVVGIQGVVGMFEGCIKLEEIDLSNINLDRVERLDRMFEGCSSLRTVNFGDNSFKNVVYANNMFNGCKKLVECGLCEKATFENLEKANSIFKDCINLRSLDFSNMRLDNLKYAPMAFYGCETLRKINFGRQSLNSLVDLYSSFVNCISLRKIYLVKADLEIDKLSSIVNMFENCSKLMELDLSKWGFSKLEYINGVFRGCARLKHIKFRENLVIQPYCITGMFEGCSNKLRITNPVKIDTSALNDKCLEEYRYFKEIVSRGAGE